MATCTQAPDSNIHREPSGACIWKAPFQLAIQLVPLHFHKAGRTAQVHSTCIAVHIQLVPSRLQQLHGH
jgi:hypothetical protein